jgi:hypothetical protein
MKQFAALIIIAMLAVAGCTASARVGGEEHGVSARGAVR